jgi:RNA polymerase sigma-70 factor (ECF subfamily)
MGERAELGDAELVARALTGDAPAYGALVSRYQRTAYALAFGVTRRHEDAEDAAQESFVVALERLDECRNPEKFGGWLMAIVRNRARNLVRRESLRTGEMLPASLASGLPGPDRETERSELRGRLSDALGELTEIQGEVVLLHDLEGWKHREIARVLEMPPGTVRSHLHYARKKLRELLGGVPESGPTDGDSE